MQWLPSSKSRRDGTFVACSVSSLRDLSEAFSCRRLKHTVNKVLSLRDYVGTKEALARKRAEGVVLGRPKGSKSSRKNVGRCLTLICVALSGQRGDIFALRFIGRCPLISIRASPYCTNVKLKYYSG